MSILKDKKNVKWLIAFIFIIVLAALVTVIMSFSSEKKNASNQTNLTNNYNSEEDLLVVDEGIEPVVNFLEDQDFLALAFAREEYLNANISKLSETKEVLGGTFFITSTEWIDRNTAIIEYEDGHIALKAKVVFLDDSNELSSFSNIEIEEPGYYQED